MAVRWAVASGNFSSTATWNDGAILGIPTGSDDLFSNTFTVNVNQSFDARTLNNSARARTIATPQMTSNIAPSPYVAAASSIDGSFGTSAWNAFDRNTSPTSVGWFALAPPQWISMDFGSGSSVVIDGYTIFGGDNQIQSPRYWTLESSNDNTNWTIRHTVSGAAAITANGSYSVASIGNTTGSRYYRLNVSLGGGGTRLILPELELYERFTAALAAGGSFNFNSGSISGSATSTSPLSAGATNLITVTATTGSVGLTLGGSVAPRAISNDVLISHSGNCDLILTGSNFIANGFSSTANTIYCINKSSAGTIRILGNLLGTPGTSNTFSTAALISSAGNTVIQGDVAGSLLTTSNNDNVGINQTGGNLTIIGNITGGGGTGGGTARGVNFTGTSIRVIGNIIGGPTSAGINSTAPIFVTGNVTGSAANGITTTAPVIVSGSVIATGAAAAISSTSAIFINVSGSVQASATANGISSTNASAVVNLAGNIVNVNGKQAIYCQNLFLDNTATTQARFFTFGGSDRTLYSSDTFPNLPSASNVRFGTTYGPGSGNTGTLRMASPQDVRSGVLTDNTTGSAILSMESLSNEIQTSSDPFAQRLKNLTTVDVVGNLLTAFKK
jgi:hypothetical protein